MSRTDGAAAAPPAKARTVVVIGASLGGLHCAEAMRRKGFPGRIVLIGEEPHLPYDRPPLSKQVLRSEKAFSDLLLRGADAYAELDLDFRLGRKAVAVDPRRRLVTLDEGDAVGYDALVLATGSRPRHLPGFVGMQGVFYLRGWDDTLALQKAFETGAGVALIGAGFIGGEVASSARSLGLPVTVIEGAAAPLAPVLGAEVGALMSRVYREHGVELRCGVTASRLFGDGQLTGVELSDGSRIEAGTVVVGIGATPVVDYLAGSGIPVGDGVLCDSACRVEGFRDIHALGDVARWRHPFYGSLRVEHWTNAVEQAEIVAANILDPDAPVDRASVPHSGPTNSASRSSSSDGATRRAGSSCSKAASRMPALQPATRSRRQAHRGRLLQPAEGRARDRRQLAAEIAAARLQAEPAALPA